MSVGDLIDFDFDSLMEDNMDCEKSCVGSLPHVQCRYAEHAPLGLFVTRKDEKDKLNISTSGGVKNGALIFRNQAGISSSSVVVGRSLCGRDVEEFADK